MRGADLVRLSLSVLVSPSDAGNDEVYTHLAGADGSSLSLALVQWLQALFAQPFANIDCAWYKP